MSLKLSSAVFGTRVSITRSGETGTINGFVLRKRTKTKQFFVEYTAANGCACKAWFHEDQLTVI